MTTKDNNNDNLTAKSDNSESKPNDNQPEKKQGIIRTVGAATFITLIAVLVAGVYFFAAPATKYLIVNSAQSATGAETNIEDVNITWLPFSVEITGFQQTDPSKPSHNLLSFKRTIASVDLLELLLGKTVVDELSVEGLTYDAKRSSPGQVFVHQNAEQEQTASDETDSNDDEQDKGFSIPSSDELLKDADLQTVAKGKQLKAVLKAEKKALEQAYSDLPDETALKKYEDQWQDIEKTKIESLDDLKVLKSKLKALKADVKKDNASLKTVKEQYNVSKDKVDLAYTELKQAPDQDWQKIQDTLPIQDPNAVAISQLLFGDEIAGYVDTAQTYWQKAKPYIDAHKAKKAAQEQASADPSNGRSITFTLDKVYPDVLIKRAVISIFKVTDTQTLNFELLGENLTHQSHVIDKASELTLTLVESSQAAGQQPFIAKASVYTDEHLVPDVKGTWSLLNKPLSNQSLINESDLKLNLASAKLNGNGEFSYKTVLANTNNFDFQQTQFVGSGSSELAQITVDSLTPVQSFNLLVGLKGELTAPDSKIESNLDSQLKNAFKKAIGNRWDDVKSDTKSKLNNELQSQLNLNASDMNKLDNWKSELSDAESKLDQYSEDNINKLIAEKTAEQKAEAQRKLDEEKRKAQEKLDEEKRKAQEKLDKEKKKAEDKLKNKLKDKLKDFKCCEE